MQAVEEIAVMSQEAPKVVSSPSNKDMHGDEPRETVATESAGDMVANAADEPPPNEAMKAAKGNPPPTNPNKKRKIALFMAYVGHGYQGMQRNPGVKTIEEDLFKAIHAAGGISDSNSDEQGFLKIHWMRAARTDKGVSAVGQVVSLKMVPLEGAVEKINQHLAPQIRVFGFSRVTNGFDARKHCDKRRYEYTLPAWAFDPSVCQPRRLRPSDGEACPADSAQQPQGGSGLEGDGGGQGPIEEGSGEEAGAGGQLSGRDGEGGGGDTPAASAPEEGEGGVEPPAGGQDAAGAAQAELAVPAGSEAGGTDAMDVAGEQEGGGGFVFDADCQERLSGILAQYEGTHNFHNFTVRVAASAPQAKRYILSFRCHGLLDIGGQPWVKLVVIGQSFMLHQIRKMVGLAVAEMRGTAPPGCIQLALKTHKDLNVPMAPELGLFLDECYYESYNKQWGEQHGGGIALADYQQQVDDFKARWLYPHIASRDGQEGVNAGWLRTLNDTHFEFSLWRDAVEGRLPEGVKGGRRGVGKPPLKGAGTASFIGGLEEYGHKRQRAGAGRGGGGRGRGGGSKRLCGGREEKGVGRGAASLVQASMDAEYSD